MKRIIVIISLLFIVTASTNAQVFNTGQTLKKGVLALGIQPAVHIDGGVNGGIAYAHAGYGLTSGIDVSVKAGVGRLNTFYVGGDIEFALAKHMSVAVGGHKSGDYGADATFLFDIPIKNKAIIYSGADADFDFVERTNNTGEDVNETDILVWIPVGVEVEITKSIHFLVEANIAVTSDAYHIVGGGIMLYF